MQPFLLEIKQNNPVLNQFIGAWVCLGDQNMVVDVGPSNSVRRLLRSLAERDVKRIDYVLLTHIHIDHSGGLADFLDHFPMAGVICHDNGLKHMFDPSKLWTGSRHVLGDLADDYGPVKPVKKERLIPHSQADIRDLQIIDTPGHAHHHLSFIYEGHLFPGEAAGNYFRFDHRDYLRPATPSRFFLRECLMSIDRLMAHDDLPICYTHFGKAEGSHHIMARFRDQLLRWEEWIREEISMGHDHLVERCTEKLLRKDQNLSAIGSFLPEFQKREKFLMANSIIGFIEYLEKYP